MALTSLSALTISMVALTMSAAMKMWALTMAMVALTMSAALKMGVINHVRRLQEVRSRTSLRPNLLGGVAVAVRR